MHQPLDGVDTTDGGSLPQGYAFRNALSANLGIPLRALTCNGGCHGSMTGWLTNYTRTVAITVEFQSSVSSSYLTVQAARGILTALDLGVKPWSAPKPPAVSGFLDRITATPGSIRVQGWSLDPTHSSPSNWVTVQVDGRTVRHFRANQVRDDENRRVHVVGRHGFVGTMTTTPGRHRVCVVGDQYASFTSRPVTLKQGCATVTVPPFVQDGHVDQVTPQSGGTIHVTGWAYDPQHREATGRHTVQVVAVPTGALTSRPRVLLTTTVTVPTT